MKIWWLSFCDDSLPQGSQFIGVCIVAGKDFLNAVKNTHLLKINPGGEVAGVEIPEKFIHAISPYKNKLLSVAESWKIDAILNNLNCRVPI